MNKQTSKKMPFLSSTFSYLCDISIVSPKTSVNILIMLFSKQGDTPSVKTENRDNISFSVLDNSEFGKIGFPSFERERGSSI